MQCLTPGHRFNPFEWAQASAQAHVHTLKELAASKSQANSEQSTIAKLHAQLDDFIKTKNEAETAMLQQFMELLNEKKRKIRDQNRLLATVKVDTKVGKLSPCPRQGFPVLILSFSHHRRGIERNNQVTQAGCVSHVQAKSKGSRT